LHVKHGREMPPTGKVEVYPFAGLCGWLQIHEVVGIGMQDVDVELVVGFVLVGLVVVDDGQVYTDVETDAEG